MSQATQAQSLHDQGTQRLEEYRSAYQAALGGAVAAQEKLSAGKLTEGETAEWAAKYEEAHAEIKRVTDLAANLKADLDAASPFQSLDTDPVYRRPMGAAGGTPDSSGGREHALSATETQALRGDDGSGQTWISGDPRYRITLSGSSRNAINRLMHAGRDWRTALAGMPQNLQTALTAPRTEQLMSPYIDRDGGFITAEEIRNEVISRRREMTHIRSRARVIPTQAASVSFPSSKVDTTLVKSRASKGTGADPVVLRDIFGKVQFTPSGRSQIVKVPQELVEDQTYDLVGFVSEEIGTNEMEQDEQLFLTGTGGGEPLGLLTAITKLETAGYSGLRKAIAGSGAAIVPEDIRNFPFEISAANRLNMAWLCSRPFVQAVVVLRDASGATAATGGWMFKRSDTPGTPPTLEGYPLLESEFFPNYVASGSANDPLALIANLQDYWIIERSSLQISLLQELYAATEEIGIQYRRRFDAAPVRMGGIRALVRGA